MEMASDTGRAQPSSTVSALPRPTAWAAPGFPLWLRIAFWVCIVIAVAAVLRRAAALLLPPSPGAPAQLASLDAWFASQAGLTWTHILCALAFVALLPFLFWSPHQPLACCRARLLPARLHSSRNSLCHERLRGGWVAGAFSRAVFQFALRRVADSGFYLLSTRRCIRKSEDGYFARSPSCSASPPPDPSWGSSLPLHLSRI